jgi:hypothetical protein
MAPHSTNPVEEPTQPIAVIERRRRARWYRGALSAPSLLLLLGAIGCGGDSGSPTSPSPSTTTPPVVAVTCPAPYKDGTVTATLDGTAWTSRCAYALMNSSSLGTVVAISGTDLGTPQRIIGFAFNASRPGTYSIDSATVSNGGASSIASSGTVTVTTLSTSRVSGTFFFTGSGPGGTGTVRSGTFDVAF